MTTYRIFIALLILSAGIAVQSCKELEIPTFDTGSHYIHFKDASDKETRFSFATHPGTEEYTIKIPVTLIGMALEEDTPYSISVVKDGEMATTASEGIFSITDPVFAKNVYEDSLKVVVFNSPELSEGKRITLKIEDNGRFSQGPQDYITKVIYISDIISQPEWWNDEFSATFLGPYSDIKYEHFIIATGVSDLSDMSIGEISSYVRAFVYYLRELDAKGTPLYEKDGKTKVLASITFTNV